MNLGKKFISRSTPKSWLYILFFYIIYSYIVVSTYSIEFYIFCNYNVSYHGRRCVFAVSLSNGRSKSTPPTCRNNNNIILVRWECVIDVFLNLIVQPTLTLLAAKTNTVVGYIHVKVSLRQWTNDCTHI